MPIVLYYGGKNGADSYRMKRGLELLRSNGKYDDTDVTRIDTRRVPPSEVLMTIGTSGLFSTRRLIILEGVGESPAGGAKAKNAKKSPGEAEISIDALAEVLPEDTTIVILGRALKPNSPIVTQAVKLKSGPVDITLLELEAPKERGMTAWLMDQAKKQRINLDQRAAALMAARVGAQVEVAGAELEKLSLAIGSGGRIDATLVEQLVPDSAENSIFPLIEAIAGGKRDQGLRLLRRQIAQASGNEREVSGATLSLLARHFRILLRIQLLREQGTPKNEITETLKLNSFFAEQYYTQAGRFSRAQLYAVFESLAAVDQTIKNGEAGDAVLDLLVFDISTAASTAA